MKLLELLQTRASELSLRLGEHLALALIATSIAVVIGVALGVIATRSRIVRDPVLGVTSVLQTIPSLAMLTFLLPFFGIGTVPATIALVLYALLPIVRNTYAGISGVPPGMLEMADALGLTRYQRLIWIEGRFAIPVVVAGIRTAAVVCVGIATLSAFIGAGGLGVFINRGLALNNVDLVLFGAIPAALLALYIDFSLATVEGLLKPMPKRLPLFIHAIALIGVAVFVFIGLRSMSVPNEYSGQRGNRIVVGSKNFTEQLILGQMVSILLEQNTDLSVERRLNLAGTSVCHEALLTGGIDLYVEYTGTALTSVLHRDAPADPEEAWQVAQQEYSTAFDLEWLPKLGFANTYALAVRRNEAQSNEWQSISDLSSDAPNLTAGFTPEFLERDDGYPGLSRRYGFRFASTVDMDPGLMYDAVRTGQVDVVSAFSTDGRIAAYDLALLEDNRRFFPPYDAAIVIRGDVLRRNPEIRDALESLTGRLSEGVMQKLNRAVDQERRAPRDVAREFLAGQDLIEHR